MYYSVEKALDWVMSSHKGGMKYTDFKAICEKIGNPQNNLKIIHVAGTNGKGSTVSFLRDLLISQGYKVGTLQSPHYLTHLDRIRLNGNNIPGETFKDILNKNLDLFTSYNLGMFEMDYLIMCEYFLEEKVDYAIVEVGIGGRLDSTNVSDNTFMSIITSIGLDHTEMLGDTLELICREKCGIIKPNSNVVVTRLADELLDIVKEVSDKNNSKLVITNEYEDLKDRSFRYDGEQYELLSLAKYQKQNASLALCAFKEIAKLDNFEIDYLKAKKAMANTLWKGRFEVINDSPRVILDGAHNVHGIEALVNSFDELKGSKCVIFSALKRKDYKKMCEILKKHTDKLVITKFDYQGSIDLSDFDEENKEENYKIAIKDALKVYENILICGSLYFVSEVAENIGGILNNG